MTQTPRDWQKDMEMCEAATEGPWYSVKAETASTPGWYNVLSNTNIISELIESEANAKLMAESHEALPYWLQEAKECGRRERILKESLEHCIKEYPLYDSKEIGGSLMMDFIKNTLVILYPDTPAQAAPKEREGIEVTMTLEYGGKLPKRPRIKVEEGDNQ